MEKEERYLLLTSMLDLLSEKEKIVKIITMKKDGLTYNTGL